MSFSDAGELQLRRRRTCLFLPLAALFVSFLIWVSFLRYRRRSESVVLSHRDSSSPPVRISPCSDLGARWRTVFQFLALRLLSELYLLERKNRVADSVVFHEREDLISVRSRLRLLCALWADGAVFAQRVAGESPCSPKSFRALEKTALPSFGYVSVSPSEEFSGAHCGFPTCMVQRCSAMALFACVLHLYPKTDVFKVRDYWDYLDETSSTSFAVEQASKRTPPFAGKEYQFSNPIVFNCLCLSIRNCNQDQSDQGLRYHASHLVAFDVIELDRTRKLDILVLDNGYAYSRSKGYKTLLCFSMLINHCNIHYVITGWMSNVVAVNMWLGFTASPLDFSYVEISTQVSSCQGQERSSPLISSSLEKKISLSIYLSLRVTFSVKKKIHSHQSFVRNNFFYQFFKLKKLIYVQTTLLSCGMLDTQPKEASNFIVLKLVVVDCLQKSCFKVTSLCLAQEAGSNFKSSTDPKLFSFSESGAIGFPSTVKLVYLSLSCFMLVMYCEAYEPLARDISDAFYLYVNV